jgi:hypothetical protein
VWELIKENEITRAKAKKANQRYKKLMRELDGDDADESVEEKPEIKQESEVKSEVSTPTSKRPQIYSRFKKPSAPRY